MIDYRLQNEEPTDDEILETAYQNAWLLFTGKKTFTDIALSTDFTESYMPFDPYEIISKKKFQTTIENMMAFYIETEEYEKCAFLRDYKYEEYVILMKPFDMNNEFHFLNKKK